MQVLSFSKLTPYTILGSWDSEKSKRKRIKKERERRRRDGVKIRKLEEKEENACALFQLMNPQPNHLPLDKISIALISELAVNPGVDNV